MENNNENLDELEAQLRKSLEEIRLKKLELQRKKEEEEEKKRQEEYERLRKIEEEKKNTPVLVRVHEVVDWIKVLFTVGNESDQSIIRDDVARWLRNTFVVSYYKHKELPNAFITDALTWQSVVEGLSKFHNLTIKYENGSEEAIKEAKNAPHFTVDEHSEGFRVIIHPTADYYAQSNIQSIPGAKPAAGTHTKEWIIPFIYSFLLIQKLADSKVKFTERADKRIKAELALRDELDKIAKKEDSDVFEFDFLKNNLIPRAFQKVGAEFGVVRDGNLIIADEMGLGKTLQAILIGYLLSKKWGRPCRDLIVCPAGLKENWYRELYKWLGVEAVVMAGAIPDANDMITLMVKKPPIVIINYDLIGKAVEIKGETITRENPDGTKEKVKLHDKVKWPWVELINEAGFDRIIYDEGHRLKNRNSKRSQASRLITIPRVTILTGTPITNRPQEYWPLLKLIAPNEMPNAEQFEQRYVSLDKKRAANVEELRHVVKPLMIRRTKKEVVADLPPIIRTTDYHTLSDAARPIYQKAEEGLYQTIRAFDPERAGQDQIIASILTQILRMKQICAWDKIDGTCDLATATLDSFEEDELNNKVIIFTQFVDLVDEIRKRMSGDFGTVSFTGENDMRYRYEQCDRFQNDPSVRVMVTTPRVASEGLTLTRGGAVIFNDFEWTPGAHEQAEARCYGRLNDMHGARSYYRAAANTIEDVIQEILLRKMQIIEQVVDGVAIARDEDTSVLKEVIKRLKEGR